MRWLAASMLLSITLAMGCADRGDGEDERASERGDNAPDGGCPECPPGDGGFPGDAGVPPDACGFPSDGGVPPDAGFPFPPDAGDFPPDAGDFPPDAGGYPR